MTKLEIHAYDRQKKFERIRKMSKKTIQVRAGKSILGKGTNLSMKTPDKLKDFRMKDLNNSNSADSKDLSLIERHFGIKTRA